MQKLENRCQRQSLMLPAKKKEAVTMHQPLSCMMLDLYMFCASILVMICTSASVCSYQDAGTHRKTLLQVQNLCSNHSCACCSSQTFPERLPELYPCSQQNPNERQVAGKDCADAWCSCAKDWLGPLRNVPGKEISRFAGFNQALQAWAGHYHFDVPHCIPAKPST